MGLGAEPPAAGGYEVWGQSLQPLGNFSKFLEKKSYFNPTASHFACVHSHLKELDFEHLKAKPKNLIV